MSADEAEPIVNTTAPVADPLLPLRLGLAVFPLHGRSPAAPGWAHSATRDPEAVRGWPPGCNAGIGCRANNLVVLDIDLRPSVAGKHTLMLLCHEAGSPLPITLAVSTPSGGRHLYFRAPHTRWIASGRLAAGIDVRGPGMRSGGYVVGPGSVVAGRGYGVSVLAPIAELPAWLADRLPGRHRPA